MLSKAELITTADGSRSLYMPGIGEQYHSRNGALTEARHVYIENGLTHFHRESGNKKNIRILEMGLGTGLNALLTAVSAALNDFSVHYTALEAYPVPKEVTDELHYEEVISGDQNPCAAWFEQLHACSWEKQVQINEHFDFEKKLIKLEETDFESLFDIIYYDAFAPEIQPELWTASIFEKLHRALTPGGILVTYCAKGYVRRNMSAIGFQVQRLPGPPGKREILRGLKDLT